MSMAVDGALLNLIACSVGLILPLIERVAGAAIVAPALLGGSICMQR